MAGERAARPDTDGRGCPLTGGDEGIHAAGHNRYAFLPLLCQAPYQSCRLAKAS